MSAQGGMVFSSFTFLFLFLPLVLVINRWLPLFWSNLFLLVASLFFYYLGEGSLVLLLVGSITWNYGFGRWIPYLKSPIWKKVVVGICVVGNIGLLLYYKYLLFFLENIGWIDLLSPEILADWVLPIGISFFTFQGVSYILDVSWGQEKAERSWIRLGLYIALFPQLIAGPIVKFNEIQTYLRSRVIQTNQMVSGVQQAIRGLVKKVLLANQFALVADAVFKTSADNLSTPIAWLGLLAYTLQIYFDFSGYSDMAIGLCRVMGFEIPENFRHPYIARSIRAFWRRWHISLSSWFRDYLYIPLGGNQKSIFRTYFNLFVVFLITGLWHGASWNFVIWGLLHGLFLILERARWIPVDRFPPWLGHLYTLLVVVGTWVFFRIEALDESLVFWQQLLFWKPSGDPYVLLFLQPYFWLIFLAGVLLVTPIRSQVEGWWLARAPLAWRWGILVSVYVGLFYLCLMELSITSYSPFIYFKF
ncbi:MAG: MBOAT family O-acyltransferase [Bacteroidota bacterium]